MKRELSFVVVLLAGLVFAFSASAQAQSRLGITMGGSPVSGWSIDITKPLETNSFALRGSALELGILQDRGSRGDWGILLVRKEMNKSFLSAVEVYNFMPFVGGERFQFGITAGAGAGIWEGRLSPTGRADATLAVRPMPSVKVKIGVGLDYPRLYGVRFGVSYLL